MDREQYQRRRTRSARPTAQRQRISCRPKSAFLFPHSACNLYSFFGGEEKSLGKAHVDEMSTEYPRASLGQLLWRAQRLRCPRCGEGKLFAGWFQMNVDCPRCQLKFERAPGYFLGSIYINYGFTAVTMTIGYLVLRGMLGFTNQQLAGPLVGFCVVFATFFFRYARALWLSLDCFFDPSSFDMRPK
jgi:uncharacterized protein (DUF983 family)